MKKVWQIFSYILVAALASVITLTATLGLRSPGRQPSKLNELESLITERYIGGADQIAIEDAAAAAMVKATGDRWSHYIPASEYGNFKDTMANSYVGVGITIQVTDTQDGFLITKVTPGAPAEEAGLQAGDMVVGVDGVDVRAMNTDEISGLVRGEEGSTVEITVSRDGQELTFTVERRRVNVQVATGVMLEGNVGLVTIVNFDDRCGEETIAAIEDLLDQGAEYLIFDVRNNPGGYARELVEVLDYLLPEGDLFRTVDYRGVEHVDRSDEAYLDIPMAVLVNSESYSAAEFFAVALSEYEAAIVVGQQTCGKGYFQVTYELSDGSAVSLSVGEYFTPKGRNLAGIGITPDIPVEVDEDTFAAIYAGILAPEEDPQIQAAVDALLGR